MTYFLSSCRAPLRHISSGQLVNEDGFLHAHRRLDTFVLLVGCRGTLYIEQEGHEYALGPNQFLLLFPDHDHGGTRPSEGVLSYYWCHFQVESVGYELVGEQEAGQYLFLLASDANRALGGNRYILPEFGEVVEADKVGMLFRQLLDLVDGYSEYMAHYALSLLALEISAACVVMHGFQGSESTNRIVEIMEWIRIHCGDALSVGGVAEEFGYNPNYLSNMFKRQTGPSLLRYINRTRISIAKQQLLNSNDSIRVIAARVGFSDEKHFMKLFKQMEQITPGKYRSAFYKRHMNRK